MKVSYTNETQNFQHVGGVTIPPGETRDVDASLLPDYKPEPGPEEEPPVDLIAELLKASVKNITVELPGLSDEDLARAAVLEQAAQNRKSLLAALTEETLRRLTTAAADKVATAPTNLSAEFLNGIQDSIANVLKSTDPDAALPAGVSNAGDPASEKVEA